MLSMSSSIRVMFVMVVGCLVCGGLSGAEADVPIVRWRHLSSARGELPVPLPGNQQTASLVLDIDGDGRDNFVIADRTKTPSVVWFRWAADGWQRFVIDDTPLRIEAGGAVADVNGDGKPDIIFGGDSGSNQVWWWENPAPRFDKPWRRHLIKSSGGNQHHDQIVGDFLGRGRNQLVFWNQRARKLFLTEMPDDPARLENWKVAEIWTWTQGQHEGLAAGDINQDGRINLVGGGHWFEHVGGMEFRPHKIDDYGLSRSAVGDLVEGGWPEVVLNSGDGVGPLNLYEHRDGRWVKRTLIERVDHGHTLQVADINGDGHLDIYAAEMHTPGAGDACRQWILYGDGQGNFRTQVVSTGIGNHESRLADLNGNGRLDIVGKPYTWNAPRIDVWLNEGSQ
jgi:hypothetical protein